MALQLFVLLKILQMVFSYSIREYTLSCEEAGGIMLDGQCLIFSEPGDERSWQNATDTCWELYGPLATPANPTGLYDYTRSAYPGIPFWVGGYSPPYDKNFIWNNGTQIPQNRNEFPWGPGEPLPPKKASDQRCVEVNDGYASQPCSIEKQYICILDACGAMGGVTLGYQCLLFKHEQDTTWENAATDACPLGGKLAIPAYPELLINYVNEHKTGKQFWLGGLQIEFTQHGHTTNTWYWLNGQPIQVGELPWTSDSPEDQQFISHCLDMKSLTKLVDHTHVTGPKECNETRGFICEMDTSMTKSPPTVQFEIRQISSGEYIGPATVFPQNGDEVILHYTSDPNMHMTFDIVYGKWGYIRHVMSGKILSPMANDTDTAPMNPTDGTKVVLQSDRRPWALFALDQYQNRIIHRSGKFLNTTGKYVTITGNETMNNTMGFQFMNITVPDKEVLPYGFPVISGDWQLVFSVLKSDTTKTYSAKVTIGRSKTHSTSHDFKFGFEVGIDKRSSTFTSICSSWPWSITTCSGSSSSSDTSTTYSVSDEMEQASSATWNSENARDISITVGVGQTVAVWQRIFILEHKGHKSVHLSDMFADTASSRIKPNNFDPIRHNFPSNRPTKSPFNGRNFRE